MRVNFLSALTLALAATAGALFQARDIAWGGVFFAGAILADFQAIEAAIIEAGESMLAAARRLEAMAREADHV